MFLKKKWLTMLMVITCVLLLAACGNGNGGDDPLVGSNGPQDTLPGDILPLSKAFEKYNVWIGTTTPLEKNIDRETSIDFVYVFKKGEVKYYNYAGDDNELTIEDIINMSDEEIVKHAKKNTDEKSLGKYSLNIILDDTGNNTRTEELITQKKTKLENPINFSFSQSFTREFFGTYFSGMAVYSLPTDDPDSPIQAGFLLTRTDDAPIPFKFDNRDTKSKNVTVEGK